MILTSPAMATGAEVFENVLEIKWVWEIERKWEEAWKHKMLAQTASELTPALQDFSVSGEEIRDSEAGNVELSEAEAAGANKEKGEMQVNTILKVSTTGSSRTPVHMLSPLLQEFCQYCSCHLCHEQAHRFSQHCHH
jgi:hypothetical protein